MTNQLAHADAVSWLNSLPPSSVDLVITDPPYESLEKHRKIGTTTRLSHSKSSSNDWFDIFPNSRFPELFSALFRVMPKNSHLYLFCDQETAFVAKPAAEEAGFKFWKPLIWDKVNIGMGYHYRARYEFILFFEKGKRRLNNLGISDILTHKRIANGYPTEKPVLIAQTLIEQSSKAEDLVVDPFFGSGSTLVAAQSLGRRWAGCDLSLNAHEFAKARLNLL